jgi:antitoxin component YwqK of YwqJK toxin-antitoxin module
MKKIECKYCGWSWNESDGGDDKYMCHMCDNDNSKHYLKESEESKKGKLFIPRRLSGENSRFIQWNKEQPIVDGVQINQFTHDGKKDGIWERYYFNGQLQSRGSYENDIKEGYWESYWSNGQLWSKGTYKNGKRDGIWEEYFSDGEFWYEGEWNNDKYIRDIRI